jgi:hypothetical protein
MLPELIADGHCRHSPAIVRYQQNCLNLIRKCLVLTYITCQVIVLEEAGRVLLQLGAIDSLVVEETLGVLWHPGIRLANAISLAVRSALLQVGALLLVDPSVVRSLIVSLVTYRR